MQPVTIFVPGTVRPKGSRRSFVSNQHPNGRGTPTRTLRQRQAD